MAELNLRPGEKFRLGRTSYQVLANADIEADLILTDADKDGIRQVLFVCPKGCICPGTNKVWKLRTSGKAASGDKFFTCPECGSRMDKGVPNADKPPKAEPKAEEKPCTCDANPESQDECERHGNPKPQEGQPEPEAADGCQQDIDDLKDALQQAKDEAKGKKAKAPKKPKAPKGSKKGDKGKGKAKPDAEGEGDAQGFPEVVPDAALLEKMVEDLASAKPQGVESVAPPKPTPEAIHHCFNCERPTTNPVGKGDLYLCDMCEEMREHIIECLG